MKSLEEHAKHKDLLYARAIIPDIHVVKSRPFKSEVHESEYISSFGKVNDNIREKYFSTSKISNGKEKPYSDYVRMSKGTNKFSDNPQGYLGMFYLLNNKNFF